MDSTFRDILFMTCFAGAVLLSMKIGDWLFASPAVGFGVLVVAFFVSIGLRRRSAVHQ